MKVLHDIIKAADSSIKVLQRKSNASWFSFRKIPCETKIKNINIRIDVLKSLFIDEVAEEERTNELGGYHIPRGETKKIIRQLLRDLDLPRDSHTFKPMSNSLRIFLTELDRSNKWHVYYDEKSSRDGNNIYVIESLELRLPMSISVPTAEYILPEIAESHKIESIAATKPADIAITPMMTLRV